MIRTLRIALPAALGVGGALLGLALGVAGGEGGESDGEHAAREMAGAASTFLQSLSAEQLAKVKYALGDSERLDWHYIPKPRNGLPLKEMTAAQRGAALALLRTGLSASGFEKAQAIMALEQILAAIEGPDRAFPRDSDLYYFWIFGTPGPGASWGWRAEGHHLSLSFTIAGGRAVSGSPAFFGANPAEVKAGPRQGLRVLGGDEDRGRALARSLAESQRKAAWIAEQAPPDLLLRPDADAKLRASVFEPSGVPFSMLNDEQRAQLRTLVTAYAERHRPELAAQDLAKIDAAGWDNVRFCWAGGLEPGQGHYYRIAGPTFVIEYDNTQNDANHIHSLWHDPQDDFGAEILKQHLRESHQPG